jgi:uncharacterized PurR-regulated membrane protein YhhQ (DUF165 family)
VRRHPTLYASIGIAAGVALTATVWFANWLVGKYGVVSVGFGLYAPAGVYAAGLAFTLRDITQKFAGRTVVFICILAGAAVSWLVSDLERIAFASAMAFLISELCDFGIYIMLERRWLQAVLISNTVGLVIDSLIFLSIAFGSLTFLKGQIVGKFWVTLAAVGILYLLTKVAIRKTAT